MMKSRCRDFCWMGVVCSVALSAAVLSAGAQAAARSGASGAKKLEFAAASVRPSSRKFVLLGYDFVSSTSKMPPPQGGFFSWNLPLNYLINFAYDLSAPALQREAWEALPKPIQQEWYAVEARAEGNPTRDEVRRMVRAMLEERFQLAAHLEKRESDVLALEVMKPVPGLKPHAEGTPCTLPAEMMDTKKYPQAYPPYEGFAPRCGVFNRQLSHSGERRLEMLDVTMQQIADALTLPQPVIDRTGLAGHYDAVLDFAPERMQPNPDPANVIGELPLPDSLRKELGLKLEKQRAVVDVFVLDHIGQLSEN